MHGVGAKIDMNAERVFHEPDVFIASPEQGLQIGRDLQGNLQRFSAASSIALRSEGEPAAQSGGARCGAAGKG
jgi:hypothetical protein